MIVKSSRLKSMSKHMIADIIEMLCPENSRSGNADGNRKWLDSPRNSITTNKFYNELGIINA